MANRIKLNQRQWLNIIIGCISLLVILFLLLGKMMESRTSDEFLATAVSEVQLSKIDFGDVLFVKKNGRWSGSNTLLSSTEIELLANRWQSLLQSTGRPVSRKRESGKTILLYLQQINQPIICKLSQSNEGLRFSFVGTEQEFILESTELTDYIPRSD